MDGENTMIIQSLTKFLENNTFIENELFQEEQNISDPNYYLLK
jgi:hypothetical protein